MRLSSISYSEFLGQPKEWTLQALDLGQVNLIVGKNASGKSRTLNVLGGLAQILRGKTEKQYLSGTHDVTFAHDVEGSGKTHYKLEYIDGIVKEESFKVGRTLKLKRDQAGSGWVYAEKEKRKIKFQSPPNKVIAVTRRDSLQHPYFDDLYEWARGVKHIRFASVERALVQFLGLGEKRRKEWVDLDDNVSVFRRALEEFPETFKRNLLQDLDRIGFPCTDAMLAVPSELSGMSLESPPLALSVQEKGLKCETSQIAMSDGMFRALAILININAAVLAGHLQTIIIDDIGEGLDFARSNALISLLVERAQEHDIQLVMTTNDRFVMNAVPLEYWTVLHRVNGNVRAYNHKNSKAFRDFEVLGLNNFDFFSGNFFLTTNK